MSQKVRTIEGKFFKIDYRAEKIFIEILFYLSNSEKSSNSRGFNQNRFVGEAIKMVFPTVFSATCDKLKFHPLGYGMGTLDSEADYYVRVFLPTGIDENSPFQVGCWVNRKLADVYGFLFRRNEFVKEAGLMKVLTEWLSKSKPVSFLVYDTCFVVSVGDGSSKISIQRQGCADACEIETEEELIACIRKNTVVSPENDETILFDIKNAIGLQINNLWFLM